MSSPLDSAIAFLLSQHAAEQAAIKALPVVTVTVSMTPKASKAIVAKKVTAPTVAAPSIPGVILPERCSIDAGAFIVAMRNAGRRIATEVTEGKATHAAYTDPREVRNDSICAIHAFCGYDRRIDFGAQEVAARAKAMRDLKVSKVAKGSRQEERSAARSMTGYIAGCPNNTAKRLADLNGRAEAAVERMISHMRDADNCERSQDERTLSAGLAQVERDRIAAINSDISLLVGG